MILSIMLNITIECLGRRNFISGCVYVVHHPLMFLYNALIIFFTLSICLVFKRRTFALILLSFFWIACGSVNCVLLSFRTTPFSAMDLQILSSVMGIIKIYLNPWQIALLFLLIAAVLFGLVYMWIKTPVVKGKIHYLKSASVIGAVALSVVVINVTAIAEKTEQTNYPNIADAYEDYGFAYCFSTSILDHGIKRPDNYSEDYMEMLASKLDGANKSGNKEMTQDEMPNIVMIQLESFFDVSHVIGMEYSENPIPTFTSLKENYSSGFLTVPSIGAGTANTEFEIITGFSLDYFGACEYPYKTVLKDKACESICYDLAKYGYKSHAIHNNEATFYGRNEVFANLGFDSFTSVEYMDDVKINALGWAEDDTLIKEITDAIEQTDERDFVYTITVQSHGKYPNEILEGAPMNIHITSDSYDMSDETRIAREYYLNQIREVDNFVKEVTDYFENYNEPVVIVFYGDHLPNLELTDEMLDNGNLLQTEYVIWNNFNMLVQNKDLDSYMLSAYVTDLLGIDGGYFNTNNKCVMKDSLYTDCAQYLGYDLMFGDKYIYGGADEENAHYKTMPMKMGVREIVIKDVFMESDDDEDEDVQKLVVTGKNFTPYSVVLINDKAQNTEFIDSEHIVVYNVKSLEVSDRISVSQVSDNNKTLSTTNEFVYIK